MINIEAIKDLSVAFFQSIGLEYSSVEVTEKENKIYIQIIPEENLASLYIGFRGANLNAMQHLLKSILWGKCLPRDAFLSLDIDHYREKNDEKILSILDSKIEKVLITGDSQTMPFLSPADRRLVHMTVQEKYNEDVETESFNDEEGKRTLRILKK